MKTLLIILCLSLYGCQKAYEDGYENASFSTINIFRCKGHYISYGFREYLRENRIYLPSDCDKIDSIEYDYLSSIACDSCYIIKDPEHGFILKDTNFENMINLKFPYTPK